MLMGDLFILSSVSTIKRYSSCIDMTLPIRSDMRDSNHSCSLSLDTSPSNMYFVSHFGHPKVYMKPLFGHRFQILAKPML